MCPRVIISRYTSNRHQFPIVQLQHDIFQFIGLCNRPLRRTSKEKFETSNHDCSVTICPSQVTHVRFHFLETECGEWNGNKMFHNAKSFSQTCVPSNRSYGAHKHYATLAAFDVPIANWALAESESRHKIMRLSLLFHVSERMAQL